MKRAEKIAVLTRALQSSNPQAARQHLQQITRAATRSLILIDDTDDTSQCFSDDSPVHFHDRGQEHRMTLKEAHLYAKRHFITTFFILPAKK